MGPDFTLETENLQDIFHDASLRVFPTCEDIRVGEFAEYQGVRIVEYVSRILSLYKDLPEIKERANEILLELETQYPNLNFKINEHYHSEQSNRKEFMEAESRVEIIQSFDKYFRSVNITVLPALTSLHSRLAYIKRVLEKTNEDEILPEIHSRMTRVVNFLYCRVYPDLSFWKERVKCGNSCKTEDDKLKLLEWL